MKRLLPMLITVSIISCVFLLTSCGGGKSGSAGARAKGRPAGAAQGLEAEKRPKVEAFGIVKAGIERNLSIEFPSRIKDILVVSGVTVYKGDPLIELNLSSYRSSIAAKKHQLRSAELKLEQLEREYEASGQSYSSEYKSLKNSISAKKAELVQLEEDLERKKRELEDSSDIEIKTIIRDIEDSEEEQERAQKELTKKELLYKEGAISEEELELAKQKLRETESALAKFRLNMEKLKTNRGDEIRGLELSVKQRRIELENLELQLSNLSSPELSQIKIQKEELSGIHNDLADLSEKLDRAFLTEETLVCDIEKGIVKSIFCTEGDVLQTGTKLITLIDCSSLTVEARVPEEFIREVGLGYEAQVSPLADPERKYKARVKSISDMAVEENNETIVPVILELEKKDDFLLPNFNVDIEIFLPEESKALRS